MNSNSSMTSIRESKQLLAEEVFQHIGAQIVDGVLEPGHRIRDVDVAEELHVSRTPVREALQRLERLGLVTMYPSRYTEVTAVTPETVEQTLEFAGYQAGMAARMGIARMTQHDRETLADLVEEMFTALDDDVRISHTRWAVFSFLSERSRNVQHQVLINDASMALFRNLRGWTVPDDDRERMLQVYRDFRLAVLRGDADDAERLARLMHYV
ncbi:DNA-binding GntR family transcriptional regulator [Microbacterium phyllosphaerae]|uniref:DNA-binding GntR family transcriptional regulator n=1 Tax=Microbacterium phyllosphaerae TaxID=124798 RepID=A0ABS4WU55_9MICO|nr:GntR family transcriptional regulator [Microbacterium phyllosphaerae]MBP2379738.1 DNA-binding GntR family transcriptional regulator [Microbacterium phyllosphaerae]MCS3443979.1 DNA-binding GntR family transcriptional regulator [Microbacterium phyllosphaerae]